LTPIAPHSFFASGRRILKPRSLSVRDVRAEEEPFDPFGAPLRAGTKEQSERKQALNILGSYFHDSDLLAEALQNAADAVDNRTLTDDEAPRGIDIDFDPAGKWFSVADTGTGMSREALEIVFQPNVSLKSGPMSEQVSRRWRGEKGVGLTFLLFACDSLQIVTCDGDHRYDVTVSGTNSWVRGKHSRRKVSGTITTSDPDQYRGSERYTILTVAHVDPTRFEKELFDLAEEELAWVLRTRTAVGNTTRLFAEVGRLADPDIEITLSYRDDGFDESQVRRVIPYRYATPEDLLALAESKELIPPVRVYHADELKGLEGRRIRRKLRNAAVRYVSRTITGSGYEVDSYVFAMDGNAMASVLTALEESDLGWAPNEWSGLFVATRDMPTGVQLRPGIQRGHALLAIDQLPLSVGRRLDDDRLQEVRLAGALVDVIEETTNLGSPPPVPALVRPHKEGVLNFADQPRL
jgi:hypothetical protein